jgi:hypothetical protein
MNLGELLQLLRGPILNDRTDRIAGTSDYLWEDETLVTYINEAQRRFAVRSLILRDGTTPEVTEIVLQEGVDTYVLHRSVLAVVSARMLDQRVDLRRAGHSMLSAYRTVSDTWIDPCCFIGLPDGPPVAFSTDEELSTDDCDSLAVVTLRVYPTPSAAVDGKTLKLRVVRKPIESLCVTNLTAVPEIPEDHHIEMLDWAAYLALRIVDDDAGSPRRAEEFALAFEGHVREARATAMRKLFAPTRMGFGRGGFVWSNN